VSMFPRKHKYGAVKTECGAKHMHASGIEAKRCDQLHAMEVAGEITHLTQQPVFKIELNGRLVCKVVGDFQYRMADSGLLMTIDVKGMDNRVSQLKRKLVEAAFPGTIMTIWPPKVRKKRKAKAA
jgi:hypothetical protein